jgi:hypothetical protein
MKSTRRCLVKFVDGLQVVTQMLPPLGAVK